MRTGAKGQVVRLWLRSVTGSMLGIGPDEEVEE